MTTRHFINPQNVLPEEHDLAEITDIEIRCALCALPMEFVTDGVPADHAGHRHARCVECSPPNKFICVIITVTPESDSESS